MAKGGERKKGGRIGAGISAYLNESSVHGLRYLAGARNCVQLLFWSGVIAAAFGIAAYLIQQSTRETEQFPVITTVDTVSVKRVPFPAVTVDAGGVLNPWGYVEKAHNAIDYECYDVPFDCPADKERVRADLNFLIEAVTTRFFETLYEKIRGNTVEYFDGERKNNVRMAQDHVFPEFKEATATLALVIKKKQSRALAVLRKLAKATAATFAKFTNKNFMQSKGWGTEHFYPIVAEEAAWYEVSEEDVASCLDTMDPCASTYAEAYAIMLLPFYFNRIPYDGVGLGEIMSYFTRRVLSSPSIGDYRVFLNKAGKNTNSGDLAMTRFLTEFTGRALGSGPGNLNVTAFEIAKLFDESYYGLQYVAQVNYLGAIHRCVAVNETKMLANAWTSYLYQEVKNFNENFLQQVISQPPCTNETLDALMEISGCCSMSRPLKHEHDIVLKLMKYAIQPPHFTQSAEEREKDFANITETVPYPLRPFSNGTAFWNVNPRIHMCQYDHDPAEEATPLCHYFVRSYTNEGFGYTFNNRHFWNKHQAGNAFNQKFYHHMHPVLEGDKPDIYFAKTSGSLHGLSVVLQLNKYEEAVQGTTRLKSGTSFRVTLHDPYKPADLRSEGVSIKPGYASTFLITPSQVVTSDSVGRLDLDKRNCKFHSENGTLRIFSTYTQAACTFECSLDHAEGRCGCVPWNYPRLLSSSEICDYMGVFCFEKVRLAVCLSTTVDS